jgi:MFS family permease
MTVSSPRHVALLLGVAQTLAWGSTYYLPAVLAPVVVREFGVDAALVYGAFSVALLISGFAAPSVGRLIQLRGGRPVLIASSLVLSAGLVLLALVPGIWGWCLGWVVLGCGMALGLYEAAFATLGMLYGREARRPITIVTLCAGFASTWGWPASAALVPLLGWRGTCLAYVAVNLLCVLPLYLLLPRRAGVAPVAKPGTTAAAPMAGARRAFLLLAVFFTLRALISGVIAVHFVALFGALGLGVAGAVAIGALQGPAQVGGRLLEFTLGARAHPLDVAKAGALLLPLGALGVLLLAPGELGLAAAGFMLLYGASNGILTISKGQVPLALFGPEGYPVLMGKLALPMLVAQAVAPTLAAPVVAVLPASVSFGLIAGLSALALGCLLLLRTQPPAPPMPRPAGVGPG